MEYTKELVEKIMDGLPKLLGVGYSHNLIRSTLESFLEPELKCPCCGVSDDKHDSKCYFYASSHKTRAYGNWACYQEGWNNGV